MSLISVITAALALALMLSVKKRREAQMRGAVPYEPEYQEFPEEPVVSADVEEGQPALSGKTDLEPPADQGAATGEGKPGKLKGRDLIIHSEIMRPKYDDM